MYTNVPTARLLLAAASLCLSLGCDPTPEAKAAADALTEGTPKHKVVIQVSSADPQVHKIALNNARNLKKLHGEENVQVEIVAYGPGLAMLKADNENADALSELQESDVELCACNNTMTKIEKKTGAKPVLASGVRTVSGGVARIVELQEQGYTYIRP